jgi:predicted XRE-type DNA-binding protein
MKNMTENNPTHVVKENVLDALGFPPSEASAIKIKSELLSAILEEVKIKSYTQAQLMDILDEYQPGVSNLLRGKTSLIGIEKLLRYAQLLHLQTCITVRPIEGGSHRLPGRTKRTAQRPARKLAPAV